jgi:hypothetical protein
MQMLPPIAPADLNTVTGGAGGFKAWFSGALMLATGFQAGPMVSFHPDISRGGPGIYQPYR